MTWIVVKFEDENTVEAVPQCWYESESSKCSWPPTNTVHAKICEYIKNQNKPDKKWKTYPATILGLYDDFQTAQRKAEKAQTTNDLTSQNEETMREKKLRRKKAKKQPKRRWDSSSENQSTDQNSDDNKYPDVASLNSQTAGTDAPKRSQKNFHLHKKNPSQSSSRQAQSTSNTDSSRSNPRIFHRSLSRSLSPTSKDELYKRHDDCSGYSDKHRWNSARPSPSICSSPIKRKETNLWQSTPKHKAAESSSTSNSETVGILKEILKETVKVNLKVDDLTSMVVNLMKSNIKPICFTNTIGKPPEIMKLFPVDEMSLKELELWLTEDGNKDLLVQELIRVGGSDVVEVVKKLMYKIFTNEVGMLYSWEGAKKKKIFKKLEIASVIKDVVRNSEKTKHCSETETVNVIKAWLVRSTDRYKNETHAARKNGNENEKSV